MKWFIEIKFPLIEFKGGSKFCALSGVRSCSSHNRIGRKLLWEVAIVTTTIIIVIIAHRLMIIKQPCKSGWILSLDIIKSFTLYAFISLTNFHCYNTILISNPYEYEKKNWKRKKKKHEVLLIYNRNREHFR